MKLHVPYPLLLIVAIIVDRVVVSSGQIDFGQSLRTLAVFILITMAVSYILHHRFIKDWHYTDLVVLMAPIAFLLYRSLYGFLKIKFSQQSSLIGVLLIPLLGLLCYAIVNRKVWHSIQYPALVSGYFYFVFTLLLCFQLILLTQSERYLFKNTDSIQTTAMPDPNLVIPLQRESSPDIYVIVLDGYARQDVLNEVYEFDNSKFLHDLEKRGFFVATSNHGNYVQTPYTMASLWNFDYLPVWDEASEYDRYLYQPIQNNRVFHSLDAIGYTTVSAAGEVHYAEVRNSDLYFSDSLPLNDFESYLLTDSPLEPISNIVNLKLPLYTYKTHRHHIDYQIEILKKIPATIPGPKIVYAHILSPHPPFVFGQDGDIRETKRPFSLAEGASAQGGRDEYVNGYRGQIQFINAEIEKVIDVILATSSTPPVIVLMGDHGPASMFNFSVENPGCVWERTSNLYAVFLPGHQNDGTLYSSISPVNTFRVIFNTYFGTDLSLLEDRSYLRLWQQPTLNVDVTNKRDSLDGCSLSQDEIVLGSRLK